MRGGEAKAVWTRKQDLLGFAVGWYLQLPADFDLLTLVP